MVIEHDTIVTVRILSQMVTALGDQCMVTQNEIIDGWFVDCKPDNEIQKSRIIEFGNLFERYMLADDNRKEDREFKEIRSSTFAMAKTKF